MITKEKEIYSRHGYINLSHLSYNINLLKQRAPKNKIIFMVKSNAYGHGEIPLINYCMQHNLVDTFGMASLAEALVARRSLPLLKSNFIVFSDLFMESFKMDWSYYAQNRIIPVISRMDQLLSLLTYNQKNNSNIPLYLMINTGMNRLGFECDEQTLSEVLNLLGRFNVNQIDHLMSHFAFSYSTAEINTSMKDQYKKFNLVKEYFAQSQISIQATSMANSGAVEQGFALEESHIRPGLMLYGPSSLMQAEGRKKWKSKMVSKISCKILSKRMVKKGDRCSYGLTYIPEEGVLIVVNLGYADGIPLSITGQSFTVNGVQGQFLGRVNMDMSFLFFPKVKDTNFCSEEDIVYLWDEDPSNFYQFIGKSVHPYAALCSMQMPRLKLEYI